MTVRRQPEEGRNVYGGRKQHPDPLEFFRTPQLILFDDELAVFPYNLGMNLPDAPDGLAVCLEHNGDYILLTVAQARAVMKAMGIACEWQFKPGAPHGIPQ